MTAHTKATPRYSTFGKEDIRRRLLIAQNAAEYPDIVRRITGRARNWQSQLSHLN
jgi:hypothetical protein